MKKMIYFFIFISIALINISSYADTKLIYYKWLEAKDSTIRCYAFSELTHETMLGSTINEGNKLYNGAPVADSNCSVKQAKPIYYKWLEAKDDTIRCFAFSKLTREIMLGSTISEGNKLNNGAPVADSNCSVKQAKPIYYKWLEATDDTIRCYAFSKLTRETMLGSTIHEGNKLYKGAPVADSHCKDIVAMSYDINNITEQFAQLQLRKTNIEVDGSARKHETKHTNETDTNIANVNQSIEV